MQHNPLVAEELLDSQADYAALRQLIPELLFRLIAASVQNPTELRIPYGGSVGQRGWDGVVYAPFPFDPYVPKGQSYWEIGTGRDPEKKASDDFKTRTENTPETERATSTFVFVTPRSASHTWDVSAQKRWIDERKRESKWTDIRIIDASKIVQWLYLFPGIDFWLADKLGKSTAGLTTPDMHWELLKAYGSPPNLKPDVFMIGREKAKDELLKLLRGDTTELMFETRYPQDGVDFVVASLASLSQQERAVYEGRSLIINDPSTWSIMCQLQTPHILIAAPSLDLASTGAELRQQARVKRHGVIFAATPIGSSHGNKIQLPDINPFELEKALQSSGYHPERARTISNKCDGKTQILKRLLLDLSVSPYWASTGEASQIAMAILIGQWNGLEQGDREAVEGTLGKEYGEWTRIAHPVTLRPDPPLIQRNEKWRFISRFEGWQYLGKYITDAELDRFSQQALLVLTEDDPKFTLSKEDWWAASVHGKRTRYSNTLREGFAETLALMGSFPDSLSATSLEKAATTCDSLVREALGDDNWVRWASLNDVLPLLAEASPDQFLKSIEGKLLDRNNTTFKEIFSQESSDLGGWNYMTGVLWALETLAWSPKYLTRVTIILGYLAEIDPKLTNWGNRPSNSLSTIFLPWRPQTCAPIPKRKVAVETLLRECPLAGWHLLLSLMPNSLQMTTGSRRPSWREFIPAEFPNSVSRSDYNEQVNIYAALIVNAAAGDLERLSQLIDLLPNLPPEAYSEILRQLSSDFVMSLEQSEKLTIWEKLLGLIARHRMFADAEWAMNTEQLRSLEEITSALKPFEPQLLHRRLFSEQDLLEESGNYEEQFQKLQVRRNEAVNDILSSLGIAGLLNFSKSVAQPFQVGIALGAVATTEQDGTLLPVKLNESDPSVKSLIKGYVSSRFFYKGEQWIDGINFEKWKAEQKVEFLVLLPFTKRTWKKATELLQSREPEYWKHVEVNPFQTKEDLTEGIEQLLQNGRPWAALQCLHRMIFDKRAVPLAQVYRALLPEVSIEDRSHKRDSYVVTEVIKWLQARPDADETTLFRIEWAYLRLLDHHFGLAPKTLERQLAEDPRFFCEVIRVVYRSDKEKDVKQELDENGKALARNAYELLYKWDRPPGTKDDGSFNGPELNQWIDVVKTETSVSGHQKPALHNIGKVLAHAPADPDGLWKHKAAAEVLDKPEHGELRSAFSLELINMRGVYLGTQGEGEKALAASYHEKANSFDDRGYIRLAASLHELATYYEAEAKREAERDMFDR